MRAFALALAICSALLGEAKASSVAWDVLQLESGEFSGSGLNRTWRGTFSTGGMKTVGESGDTVDFYISFLVTRTMLPSQAHILPDTENLVLDGPESNWILANEGDLIDESTSRHLDSYFFQTGLDDGGYDGSGSIDCDYAGQYRFYMGFATGLPDWDDETGVHRSRDIFYGWALFEYSGGKVSLVQSALNADGGGIYVGTDRTTPVPEPATGGLALAGALLLLRRRRRSRISRNRSERFYRFRGRAERGRYRYSR